MKSAIARSRSSPVAARKIEDGCTVATMGGSPSTFWTTPRDWVILKVELSRLCAATAPRQTIRLRTHGVDFGVEPWTAGSNLAQAGLLVYAALAAWLPLEVFDRIGHVNGTPVDVSFVQAAIEQLS